MSYIYYRIISNDILKNKLITLVTLVFIAAAAMLVSLAAILVVNLTGGIDTLMNQAKTPHFMQMHSGEIDTRRLEAFARENGKVEKFQVLEFLNIDGGEIIINGKSLAGNVQDNGLSTQSEKFDFLLDLEGKVINPSEGEIYVPICYMKDGTARISDQALISGKRFIVAGFLRDSQMNSLLSSSKRFVVSEKDYLEIREKGNIEYLIEFRLKDLSALGSFENSYTSAGLEANGPTLTYPLFKVINAISDGLMIGVILLVSLLVVAVALLCVRFTLLAKIEEDYREIGVMKAIGLRVSDIKKVYLAKYMVVAGVGCILGLGLALLLKGMLLENIRLYMGESDTSSFAFLLGIIGVLLVFMIIISYVWRVLRKFEKISAAEAIRFGNSQEGFAGAKKFCLSNNRFLSTNIFLGVKDVLIRKRLYATMLVVLVISAFIIIVPQNLYNTIASESFIKYMGIGNCDIRIDLQQNENISQKAAEISKAMDADQALAKYAVFTTKTFQVRMEDGSEGRLKIELGDHLVFPLEYLEGRAPVAENEIALSIINATELGKKVGHGIRLVIEGEEKNLTVCGIYSDITNGGKTAKATFNDDKGAIMWSVIQVELHDKSLAEQKALEYGGRFDYAKVSNIEQYINQTFGSTISAVKKAYFAAIIIALIITALVTMLFMKMLVSKDRPAIAVLKALGFTRADIRAQYIARSLLVLFVGIILGTFLANTLGELLVGQIIAIFGATSFKFIVNPFFAYLLTPLLMICSGIIATIIGTSGAGQIKIFENIKE